MGGKTFNAKRMTKAEFQALAGSVSTALEATFPGSRPHVIRAVRAKETHGDLDLLVEASALPGDPLQELAKALGATRALGHRNSPTTNLLVGDYQVDVTRVEPGEYEAAAAFFAYGDLGGLMGQVARSMGFSYGFRGLRYRMKDGTNHFDDVLVTASPSEAFEFLGYLPAATRYSDFEQGFGTTEETFEFAASSLFFDPAVYEFENRSHRSRSRDRDRPNYLAFLEWLKKSKAKKGRRAGLPKEDHLARALHRFPEFAVRYVDAMRRYTDGVAAHTKFNGHTVSAWTGRSGPGLGHLMEALKASVPDGFANQAAYVLATSTEGLRQWVTDVDRRMVVGQSTLRTARETHDADGS